MKSELISFPQLINNFHVEYVGYYIYYCDPTLQDNIWIR